MLPANGGVGGQVKSEESAGGNGDGNFGEAGGEISKACVFRDGTADAGATSVVAGAGDVSDRGNATAESLSASVLGRTSGGDGHIASRECLQRVHAVCGAHGSAVGTATEQSFSGCGREVLDRIKGLTVALQEIRADLEARSLEREQMPIFRALFAIVWFLVKIIDSRDVGEGQSDQNVILQRVADSLCQLLQYHGIEMFRSKPGDPFDVGTMRLLSSVPANPKSALLVEESCRPGFRLGQRVLECELVKVKPAEGAPENPSADHHILREHLMT